MSNRKKFEELIKNFNPKILQDTFQRSNDYFREKNREIYLEKEDGFSDIVQLGEFELEDSKILVASSKTLDSLTEKSGRKAQYDIAKKILKKYREYQAGIFIFYDEKGDFRISLIYTDYLGTKVKYSTFRRFTYFVSSELENVTFLQQVSPFDFKNLKELKELFSVEKVTEAFFKEIANWYFWAIKNTQFPKEAELEEGGRNIAIIRFLTRMIFVWFMREQELVPKDLFEKNHIQNILKSLKNDESTYYEAILQNLFFATLSTKKEERQFRSEIRGHKGFNPDYGNQYVFRFQELFKNPENIQYYFQDIPFLNGGLFECLDDKRNNLIIDGFSEVKKNQPIFPNFLFFSQEQEIDLNDVYNTKNKSYKVRGLMSILSSYNFTIDENSPYDSEVSLDPELLGRVFENLLASFDPVTSTTARKSTGSFYTPREIVNYMVEESLKEYFKTNLSEIKNLEEKLKNLFSPDEDNLFSEVESKRIIKLIEGVRIVDPAVGSGAFPMGILNKMVFLLKKIDPKNKLWKEAQTEAVERIPDPKVRDKTKKQIEEFFENKNADYGRKLYLIQKSIYGVDIQLIAVEITKLRFFISLLVDEKIDKEKENWGIEPLPNLDLKIMQGDSLISSYLGVDFDFDLIKQETLSLLVSQEDILIKKLEQKKDLYQNEPDKELKNKLKKEIEDLIIEIFTTKIKDKKEQQAYKIKEIKDKYSTISNKKTREEAISKEAKSFSQEQNFNIDKLEMELRNLTNKNKKRTFFPWKLYFAEVFENGGFDIVIGNPPYIQLQKSIEENKGEGRVKKYGDLYQDQNYQTFEKTGDMYGLFYEKGINLLKNSGHLCYITSNKWMRAGYGKKIRKFFLDYNPKILLDLGGQVFKGPTVDTNILLTQKELNQNKLRALTIREENKLSVNLSSELLDNGYELKNLTEKGWFIGSEDEISLKNKIERLGKPLKDWDVRINYGIKTGLNEAFIIDKKTKDRLISENPKSTEIIKPTLRGKDIKRYYYNFADVYVIVVKFGFSDKLKEYPAALKHLKNYEEKLRKRGQCNSTRSGKVLKGKIGETGQHHWLELDNNPGDDYLSQFEKEKIVWGNISYNSEFSLVDKNIYVNAPANILTSSNVSIKFLIACLNSSIFNYEFKQKGIFLGKAYEWKRQYVENVHIPIVTKENFSIINQMEILVDKIISLKKQDPKNNTQELENQIDQLVYKLYDLDEEEIKIIENRDSIIS